MSTQPVYPQQQAPPPPPPPSAGARAVAMDGSTGDPSFGTMVLIRTSGEGVTPETYEVIAGIQDIDGPTVSMGEIDTTSHSTGVPIRTYIPGLIDPGTLSFPCFFRPSDPTHSITSTYGLEYLFYNRKIWKFRLVNTDAGRRTREFYGFVQELSESYPTEGVNTRDVTIRVSGKMAEVVTTVGFTPANASPTAAGGAASVAVDTAGSGTSWTAASDVGWITISSPTEPVTGNGNVSYTVAANASGSTRTGHIMVLNQPFTVTQAA